MPCARPDCDDIWTALLPPRMGSIFPINELPRDILEEIFWNCMPETIPGKRVQMSKSSDAPLLVCSICSSWRNLAIAMPKLWTAVRITISNLNMDPSDSVRIIDTWLKRSGSLPLTLNLQFSLQSRPGFLALVKSILSVFYSHASRWQDVTLRSFDSQLLPLPQLNTPLLRSFCLSTLGNSEPIHFSFRECQRLTRLGWPFPLDVSKSHQSPWSKISCLRISGLTFFLASEMIRLCPQLEEFSVHCSNFSKDPIPPREPKVVNHCLRILSLHTYKDRSSLLHSIALPALEEFSYTFESPWGNFSSIQQSLLDFLTRSKCKLKKLGLGNCKFSTYGFLECLEHEASETIQELNIAEWPQFTDDVLIRLTDLSSPATPRILLPKLRRLTLELCLDASPGKLGDLVSSRYYPRTNGMEKLKALSLLVTGLDEEDEDVIESAAKNGLRLSISFFDIW